MSELIFIVAILTLAIGATLLWVNLQRIVNRIFALVSLTATSWLFFVFMALHTGNRYPADLSADPVPWLRAASAVGAFFPWIVWLLKESVVVLEGGLKKLFLRYIVWPVKLRRRVKCSIVLR